MVTLKQQASVTPQAIHFRGQACSGAKGFWDGTQRSVSPAETLARIRPYFPRFGVTRIANITGLDWIGIPVTMAFRPNASTLSNGSGKGFSLEAAMVSGAMEAIELCHAEQADLPTFQMPYEHLPGPRIPMEEFPRTRNNLFNTWWPFRWTMGWDIVNQEDVAVPWWMIHMGEHSLRDRDLHTFQLTSNGLASGNNLLEAVNAGLFEVIERDAVTTHRLAWVRQKRLPPIVRPETIMHPMVVELMARLASARVGLVLFDCTLDTAVPVYMAYVYDLAVRNMGIYRGYGAHLDPEVAMIRAVTEAVQARAIYIAGSRDDVFRHSYLRLHQPDDSMLVRTLQSLNATVDARDRVSEATPTFEGDTLTALDKLRACGLKRVIVVDLSLPDVVPIKVVKVIVPRLEGYMFEFYEPGPRATAFLRRSQSEGSHLSGPDAPAA